MRMIHFSFIPTDTPGINLIFKQLTGTENSGVWSRAMLIAVRAKNNLAFVDVTSPRPTGKENMLPIWEQCNAIVLSWILNSVSKEIFGAIIFIPRMQDMSRNI